MERASALFLPVLFYPKILRAVRPCLKKPVVHPKGFSDKADCVSYSGGQSESKYFTFSHRETGLNFTS
tara:strand:- start:1588 stop:1791 length:204 start_codon:yes stop_codon:yes gene_type:complete